MRLFPQTLSGLTSTLLFFNLMIQVKSLVLIKNLVLKNGGRFSTRLKAAQHRDVDGLFSTGTNVGFSFSPGGLLFPYQLGIAKSLCDRGILNERTPLAGSSSGALVAAMVGGGVSFETALQGCAEIYSECIAKGGARWNINDILERKLYGLFPMDIHEILNAREGSVQIAITQFTPLPRGKIIKKYESRADVIEVLLASCCVPFWFSSSPTVRCRGYWSIDGFFAFKRSQFGCLQFDPILVEKTIKVLPFSYKDLKVLGEEDEGNIISPAMDPYFPYSVVELLKLALNPSSEDTLQQLFEFGCVHGQQWEFGTTQQKTTPAPETQKNEAYKQN